MKHIKNNFCYVPAKKIKFIFEQDGPPEQKLKTELSKLFISDRNIFKAYLIRIVYESSNDYTVALCVAMTSGDEIMIVRKIANIFSKMFGEDQHLEIMFLDDKMETKVAGACGPFYVKSING